MKKNTTSLIIAFAITMLQQMQTTNAQALCDSLIAPCSDTYSENGFYFQLQAGAANTLIKSFSTVSQNGGVRDVAIYYKTGSYAGFESNSSAWTIIGSASGFDPLNSLSCPIPETKIPINVNVCIPSGQVYSFYIIRSNGSGTFEANKATPEGQIAVTDGSISLYAGKGTVDFFPFQGSFLRDSLTFQGTIDYSCGCSVTGTSHINAENNDVTYPVPANDKINFDFYSVADNLIAINVFDMNGRKVLHQLQPVKIGLNKITIEVSDLHSGIYSFQLTNQDPSAIVLKKSVFVKE